MRRLAVLGLLLAGGIAAGAAWWVTRRHESDGSLVLYGNVDLRQVLLAFNNSERIADVLVREGDRVERGEIVARLDTSRLEPQLREAEARAAAQRQVVERLHHGSRPEEIAQAEARVAAQQHIVERLRNGTRPEEIEQARANVAAAQAEAVNARRRYERVENLIARGAATQETLDDARAASAEAQARLAVSQEALDLALAGPRPEEIAEAEALLAMQEAALKLAVAGPRAEEIAEAEARLRAAEAEVALLKQRLDDAELRAPTDAVVRSRLLEPGEMASPQRPVVSLAVLDPKWVRAYVSEPDLAQVRPGMAAAVTIDGFPGRSFEGWIGFISPVAEFTPKTVQTEELRTSLVYEVRVFVKDPNNVLRLGMPATVRLLPDRERRDPATAVPSDPGVAGAGAHADAPDRWGRFDDEGRKTVTVWGMLPQPPPLGTSNRSGTDSVEGL